jgi:hypothetical protein
MIIEPDVKGVAAHFGVDPSLIQAVVNAEGDILKAVQCSVPSVQTREKALDVLCRSAVHAMSDYVRLKPESRAEFVAYWGERWAPIGAKNDPHALNANWVPNVRKLWNV